MNIKELRVELNMTQQQLAQELGVSVSAVSKWETTPDRQPHPFIQKHIDRLIKKAEEERHDAV